MGMIFVPLFDIIVGDLDDDEVGSASGVLASVQQLGASLGIAVLGTIFFSTAGDLRLITVIAIGLTAVTFLLGFLLPKKTKAAVH